MNPKNDNEKEIESALEGSNEPEGELVDLYDIAQNAEACEAGEETAPPESGENEMVDLFALAADHEVPPAPALEDIFIIENADSEEVIYPEGFEETEESFYTAGSDDDEVFDNAHDEEDFDESDGDEEDFDESDGDEEDFDESDDGEEDFDESDNDEEDFDDSDDDEEDFDESDNDEEDFDDSDDDEEDFDESDDDEEDFDESDDDEEDFDESDDEEDFDESDYSEDYNVSDYGDDDEDDDESDNDKDYDEDYDDYDDDDEEEDEDFIFTGEMPDSSSFSEPDIIENDSNTIDINQFAIAPEEESVDLFEVANTANDLPETQNHSNFYYWAKRKTVSGWVKFALKCTAAILLILVASGVLYFNGLLNLIDYKAADDFEQYDNLSDTDYRDDEDVVYSNPVYYNESTTIEGFNESMIDIPKKDVLNILLIGTDVRGGTYEERGNTDSMILVSVNTRDKNIKLTSFMRDMYVDIPDRDWARLNVAYAYGGPQLLFDTLKKNFNVDVDLYIRVNFANFRKIVNHVGGVDIELSEAEAKYMNDTSEKYKTKPVEPGMQHLDGAQALSYARCRKIDSDFNRTKRQRTVIIALVKEIKHCSPGELNSLLNVFLPMIQTNMSKMQILGLMADGTRYLNNDIETLNVPIKNSWRSETIRKRSVICPNFELNKTAIVAHVYSTYRLDVEKTKYQSFQIPN